MDPILAIRTCFIAGIAVGITVESIPYLRTRFLAYGPRTTTTPQTPSTSYISHLDSLLAYPVPHHWFLHYYILSVCLSLFWGIQLFTRGRLLLWLCSLSTQSLDTSMTRERVYLAWFLLLLQGSRRLYESLIFLRSKPSASTMSMSIYLIGLVYYVLDSMAVWIEGCATMAQTPPLTWTRMLQMARYQAAPGWRVIPGLLVFIFASGMQHDAHRYLASLKKYSLPQHPLFASIICPHYLLECVIYLALAFVAAPPGQVVNKTVFTTFLFTTVNLGIVAKGAKEWSVKKFGEQAQARWRMVPYIW